jgi:hypothetical protein
MAAAEIPNSAERVPTIRRVGDSQSVIASLGLLADLAGTWKGSGFNLIARPDFEDKANLYLQLNQTDEQLEFRAIGSPIPNRGFGQPDIALAGLTYLDRIHDAQTDSALHIEPGIWITQGPTTYPPETAPAGEQFVARMASIPHGNALLARGVASEFDGPPTLAVPGANYAFSTFPSFNSTPFKVETPINAPGTTEALIAPEPPGFTGYDLAIPEGPENPRTPFKTTGPPLPPEIDGVPMQDVVKDPIKLLQQKITEQKADGHTFKGVALNVATEAKIRFFDNPNSKPGDEPPAPTTVVEVPGASGGIENIPFLQGGEPTGAKGPNALTALVYATFWIEKVSHPKQPDFMQLQYAQMTILDFAIFKALPGVVDFAWPHISVATLRRTFL